ncbi:MAG: 50S ribosome-binding GTPase [Candidatus Thermoplasmatota archaeon]|nr:50S ribosome-binding GTPase [Candidatus Thermoplasmatota archaeon]
MKVQVSDPDYRFRMQKLNLSKVDSFSSVIDSTLEGYVKAFPSFGNIPPFYMALIDLLYPIDDIRRILGRIDGARKQIVVIAGKTKRQITRTAKTPYMDMKRAEAYGRISSIVNALDEDLRTLSRVRDGFKRLPSIPTSLPTVVIAGYPSVGKSQLIRAISTAKPEVAPYPFTTHDLIVGYFTRGRAKYQLVDTPGLLDRTFEERNIIEKQSILALSLLSDLCIYMLDPTGHCGFPLEPQLKLLDSLVRNLEDMRFIICVNKMDLGQPDLSSIDEAVSRYGDRVVEYITLSALEGEGLEDVLEAMVLNSGLPEVSFELDPAEK